MPAIPLPFVVSCVLALVVLRLMKHRSQDHWFLLFVGACAIQTTLVGLRWSLGLGEVRFLQPVLAACLPPVALAAFISLRGAVASRWHPLWPVAVVVSWLGVPAVIDPLLVVEFAVYGLAILALRLPEEVLTRVRIGDGWTIAYARVGIATLLLLSAVSDTIVSIALTDGDRAVAAPVIAAMMSVILIGLAGGLLGWTAAATPEEAEDQAPIDPREILADTGEEQGIVETAEATLSRGLYRDYDLTLGRLARRTGIPARKISRAVNLIKGCSVTDLVNDYRAREAMRLLRQTDIPITQVMLEAGFQTKSNFNRAFKEIAGQTPSAGAPMAGLSQTAFSSAARLVCQGESWCSRYRAAEHRMTSINAMI